MPEFTNSEKINSVNGYPMPWTAGFLSLIGAIVRPVAQGTLVLLPNEQAVAAAGATPSLDFAVHFDDLTLIQATRWPDQAEQPPALLQKKVWMWQLSAPSTVPATPSEDCYVASVGPGLHEDFQEYSWEAPLGSKRSVRVCGVPWQQMPPAVLHGIVRVNKAVLQTGEDPIRLRTEIPAAQYKPRYEVEIVSIANETGIRCSLIIDGGNNAAPMDFTLDANGIFQSPEMQSIAVSLNRPPSFSVQISGSVNNGQSVSKRVRLPNPRLGQLSFPVRCTLRKEDLH